MTCDPTTLSKLSSCLRCLADASLMQIKTYLLCQWFSKVASGTPGVPSSPDITALSTATNIVVTWTNPTPMAATNEIWKSPDGITFSLFATVSGSTNQVVDASTLNVGQFFYYKIRSCNGTNCSTFSNTISAVSIFTSPNVASISFPTLVRAFGLPASFTASGLAALTSVSLPALKRSDGTLNLSANPALTSVNLNSLQVVTAGSLFLGANNITGALSLPALLSTGIDFQTQSNPLVTSVSAPNMTSCGGILQIGANNNLTSVNFPLLQTVGNILFFESDPAITTISFPSLTSVGSITGDSCTLLQSLSLAALVSVLGTVDCHGCPALITVSWSNAIFTDGITVNFATCALNAASVNLVLRRGVVSGDTSCDFELAAGTNAAPSGQGVADKTTLITAGNTCNTN